MDPINYSIDVATPFQAGLQGFQGGLAITDALHQREAQQLQAQQQKQMQQDFSLLASNPNPTGKDYSAMMTRYPQLADHFKKSWDVLSADQQQNKLTQATQVHAALMQGRPEVAAQLLKNQADAFKNSGNERDFQSTDTFRKLIELDPQSARTTSGLMLSSIMGGDKYAGAFGQLGAEQRATDLAPSSLARSNAEAESARYKAQGDAYLPQKTQAEAQAQVYGTQIKGYEAANTPQRLALENSNTRAQIQNIDSQIGERGQRLNLDRDKLTSDTELKLFELNQKATTLTDDARKLVNDNAIASTAAEQSATQLNDLANKLETSGASAGVSAKGTELYKSLTGNQDSISQLRNEYVRLRSTQVSKMLPPGAASDKDVALALSGFPPETADPKTLASFLRGMSRLQQIDAAASSAKAEWVNSVGHLGKPKKDIEINGIQVPAGTTYSDFATRYVTKMGDERVAKQSVESAQGRSYMRHAQPTRGVGGEW